MQILISALAMTALALVWFFVQRWTYVQTPTASGDYLQGRWGCGDCSVTEDCVLKTLTTSESDPS
ncbi:hypothetical protein HQ496_03405 [bacterium]|nr:hypothetical protein [bacterium]